MPAASDSAADSTAARRPRADAERNRLRLLDAAKQAFADRGAGASLEEIARTAGVGIGTLYRHFPTREALIEAVYRNESEQITAVAERLAQTQAPVEALRQWLVLFIDYMAAKHGMYEALNSLAGGGSNLRASSGGKVMETAEALVGRAVASGDIRPELEPLDLLRAVAGVANLDAGPDGKAAARRLVDVLIAGMLAR